MLRTCSSNRKGSVHTFNTFATQTETRHIFPTSHIFVELMGLNLEYVWWMIL